LKLYLLASPNAADAKEVQDKIYSLEYREEKTRQEERQKEDVKGSLAGAWLAKDFNPDGRERSAGAANIQLINNQFTCTLDWPSGRVAALTGQLNELSLTGSADVFTCCPQESRPGSFTGTVSADGQSIALQVSWGGHMVDDYKLTRSVGTQENYDNSSTLDTSYSPT